jgi:hypothetical protein
MSLIAPFTTRRLSSRTTTIIMSTNSEQTPDTSSHLNTKQKLRIQKRRVARQKLHEVFALKRRDQKPYSQSTLHLNAPRQCAGCMLRSTGLESPSTKPEEIATQELENLALTETEEKPASVNIPPIVGREKPKL